MIVEINESKYGKKKKNKWDKKVNEKWLFTGVEKGSAFFKVVEDGTKEILLKIIRQNILFRSMIM